jgi:hypothetical protein
MKIARRKVFAIGVASLFAGSTCAFIASRLVCRSVGASSGASLALLESLLASPRVAAEIGEAVLSGRRTAVNIGAVDSASDRLAAALRYSCAETARAEIFRLIESDFANGETIIAAGWVVSRTEAEICSQFVRRRHEVNA